jgi:putative FmdB family regulatory protein
MPIYEFRCDQGHTFEVMQRIGDDPVATCQTCSAPVSRVFHPVAVHFKGKGFYATDYGSRKRSRELNDAAEGKGKHAKDDGSSSSKSDSDSKSDSSSGTSEKSAKSEPAASSTQAKD